MNQEEAGSKPLHSKWRWLRCFKSKNVLKGHFPLELSRHDILEKDYVSQQAGELRDHRYSREKLLGKTWLLCISCKKFA